MRQSIVVIGGGTCGAAAAHALRENGFDGRLILFGEEENVPYERPSLSKGYLLGTTSRDALAVRPGDWYRDNDVELRSATKVTAIDPRDSSVMLATGERQRYDRLLIATGSRPRVMSDAHGIGHYLRTIGDADRLRSRLSAASHVVIVGGGLIGLEVAAAARRGGVAVTVLEAAPTPLERALGPELGAACASIHRDEGVDLRLAERVAEIRDYGGAYRIHTTRDAVLECDLVVIGVGVEPEVDFLMGSGIGTNNGVVVDEYGCTSWDNVFAAGDVANHFHPLVGRHVRVEHHDNALRQGRVVAGNMLGRHQAYTDPHWFWSDQYEHCLQGVGQLGASRDLVIRGSVADHHYLAFSLVDGKVVGAVGLNSGSGIHAARKLVLSGAVVDPEHLRDEDIDLRTLARTVVRP